MIHRYRDVTTENELYLLLILNTFKGLQWEVLGICQKIFLISKFWYWFYKPYFYLCVWNIFTFLEVMKRNNCLYDVGNDVWYLLNLLIVPNSTRYDSHSMLLRNNDSDGYPYNTYSFGMRVNKDTFVGHLKKWIMNEMRIHSPHKAIVFLLLI